MNQEASSANSVIPNPVTFAVAICVGPGERELARFRDLAESLFYHEPGVNRFIVVDDSLVPRPLLEGLTIPSTCHAAVIPNPRRGRGSGWGAGLTAAILAAMRWIYDQGPVSFVLKVDTDTLIVAPFAERVYQKFMACPNVGMMGSCWQFPDRPRNFFAERSIAPAMEKLLRQFSIWRRTYYKWPRLQLWFYGKYGRIRSILRQALLNGYILGENCLGGGYALSWDALKAMSEAGLLDEPMLWINTPCSEDVVISLYVKRVCKAFLDFNAKGEPFCVSVKDCPFSPEEIVRRGHAIAHSVISCGGWEESRTRAFFAALRQPGSIEPSPNTIKTVKI